MESEEQIYVPCFQDGPLRQGEIVIGLIQARLNIDSINSPEPIVDYIIHPYAIVVSQDCDLSWDYRARQDQAEVHKLIPNILFCEVSTAEELRGRGPEAGINRKTWNDVKNNKHERYHFLQAIARDEDVMGEGLPELGIDFKRYFTIPAAEVYIRLNSNEIQRRCRLVSPYLEHFSTRFAYYQFRVALPADHYSEPTQN
jgi:hypothetical protein